VPGNQNLSINQKDQKNAKIQYFLSFQNDLAFLPFNEEELFREKKS